jgi:hypothetical protein
MDTIDTPGFEECLSNNTSSTLIRQSQFSAVFGKATQETNALNFQSFRELFFALIYKF